MKTLTIVIVAIVAILYTTVATADAYEDCFNFIEGKLGEKEMTSPKVAALIKSCHDAKLREIAATEESRTVYKEAVIPRFAVWQGLGPPRPLDNLIGTIKGFAGAAESVNRALNPERFFGFGYGGRHHGGHYYAPRYVMFHDPHIGSHY